MLTSANHTSAIVEAPSLLEPNYRFTSMSLETMIGKIASKKIDLNPPYQRGEVWTEKNQQTLIQSIALGLFIPEVLFYENGKKVLEAVDGKQRMTSIKLFFDGEIGLHFEPWVKVQYPDIYKHYHNTYYTLCKNAPLDRKIMPEHGRSHFENYPLRYSFLENKNTPFILNKTFHYINTRSSKLTVEENINGDYNGPFLSIIHEFAKSDVVHKSVPVSLATLLGDQKVRRMKYVTMLGRFVYLTEKLGVNPFSNVDYGKKTADSKRIQAFLQEKNEALAKLDHDEFMAERARYRKMIINALRPCYEIFGETVFATNKNTPSQTNNSLFEVLMLGFNKTTGDIQLCQKELTDKLDALIQEKGEFYDSLSTRGTDTAKIRIRNSTWFNVVQETLSELEQRQQFPAELKYEMFTPGMSCRWCNTPIHDVNLTHIDHVVSLKNGGSNSRSNLQLLHKTCNLRKRTLSLAPQPVDEPAELVEA